MPKRVYINHHVRKLKSGKVVHVKSYFRDIEGIKRRHEERKRDQPKTIQKLKKHYMFEIFTKPFNEQETDKIANFVHNKRKKELKNQLTELEIKQEENFRKGIFDDRFNREVYIISTSYIIRSGCYVN